MICIVGGGPSGLAASIALAQAGFPVKVVDRAVPPIDKACGEGLLPDSIAALEQLGVRVPAGLGFPFRGIRFCEGRLTAAATFDHGTGLGLRRTILHSLLVDRATSLGVVLQWGVRDEISEGYDLVVGADGGHSGTRRGAGLDQGSRQSHRYGFRQHFEVAPWSEYVEVYWGSQCQAYVTPISRREVGVAVLSGDAQFRVKDGLNMFPTLSERLKDALPTSAERGCLSSMRRLPKVQQGRVVLVGDASGSVDVITGEGIGLGFRQALALAQALQHGGLNQYAKMHRSLSRKPHLMAKMLLTLGGSDRLRRPVMAGLSLCPPLFSSLLAFHVGS